MRVLFVLLLAVLMSPPAWPDESVLSLRDALDMALRQNPSILAAERDLAAARSNERGAAALANPEIIITPGISGKAGSDEELLFTQPLEINGLRSLRGRIARAETDASRAAYESVRRDVMRAVKQAYWDAVQAGSAVELARQSVTLGEALLRAAERQRDAGAAPGAQVIKAQVETVRSRQELARAEAVLAQAKASLNTLLGRPPDTQFPIASKLSFRPIELDASALLRSATEKRPEILEASALLSAKQAEARAAGARLRPDVVFQARQETLGGDGGLAVGVSIPMLDWGSVKHDRRRAQAAAEAQAKRLESARNAVLLDVESALIRTRQTQNLIAEYEEGVLSQAEQLYEMAEKGYKAGATGYLEVLEAQRTLRAVQTEYYSAVADYQKALAQLEWASGVDLSTLMAKETNQ